MGTGLCLPLLGQSPATLQPHDPAAMNEQPGAPKLLGRHIGEETIDENKELLAKIGSDSILKAPAIKGSIYFYVNSCSDGNQSKEELIDDPTALNAAIKNLSIEIKYENKHHRWAAQLPHTLKILEFAVARLRLNNNTSSDNLGINAELKWRGEKDFENIIHLTQSKGNAEWQISRFA
ncbi:hypothetical protein [Cyanobium sp. Tous-M-B4]|uniref:hypothetical protein n=1 Tax=Cyanobium sp. Tous-M-B4 TaxID=2823724 RepID=UPI0020CEAAF7|nr:hypothetical protein [Cyanobium sp. Tous-M-B4]